MPCSRNLVVHLVDDSSLVIQSPHLVLSAVMLKLLTAVSEIWQVNTAPSNPVFGASYNLSGYTAQCW